MGRRGEGVWKNTKKHYISDEQPLIKFRKLWLFFQVCYSLTMETLGLYINQKWKQWLATKAEQIFFQLKFIFNSVVVAIMFYQIVNIFIIKIYSMFYNIPLHVLTSTLLSTNYPCNAVIACYISNSIFK